MTSCRHVSKDLSVALCELVDVEIDFSSLGRDLGGCEVAKKPLYKWIQRVMCSHDLAVVPLCVGDVFLCVFDDSTDLIQDLLWQTRPCFDNILWYPLCPRFQLYVLLRCPRGLCGDLVSIGVDLAFS